MMYSLIHRIILNSFLIFFLVALIVGGKRLLKSHLTLTVQYHLWFPFLFILAVPFIPTNFLEFQNWNQWSVLFKKTAQTNLISDMTKSAQAGQITSDGWIQDFSLTFNHTLSDNLYRGLLFLWLVGVIFMTAVTICSYLKINRLRRASLPLQNKAVTALYALCKRELSITKDIPIRTTAYLKSPVTIGVIRPCIIIPLSILSQLPEEKMRYILMHELQHYKHRDTLINQFACLGQILYWFHPAVWLSLKIMRSDCEMACDGSVLSKLNQHDYVSYGITLLYFTSKTPDILYSPEASIGGSARELKKRILNIKFYQKDTKWRNFKSTAVLILITVMVFALTPVICSNAAGGDLYHSPSSNTISIDLDSYFRGYDGSFVLYDKNAGLYQIYNEKNASKRISPESTYKIYSALSALEHGIITPESNVILWDHKEYPIKAWNQDHNLFSAMRYSVNWYFKALDEQVGLAALENTLSTIQYGNQDLSSGIGEYWLKSSLKISPVEQTELLTKLYDETLPFSSNSMQTVKDTLYRFSSGSSSLYGKTGTGSNNHSDVNGWFVGFVETEDNVYVFATNIQGQEKANGSIASQITFDILNALSIIHNKL